ncbi:MAG: HAD hydrolase family protein [Tidjanibacter sp.]|nr:HAD hydrolase family protein [Tidjanibacter sp.]
MGNFKEDIAKVEAFVFDVDGVFTDGGIIPLANGDFIRKYNAKDGYAVAYAVKHGYKVIIISGGRGETLAKRFRHLNVSELHIDVSDKLGCLNEIIERNGFNRENVLFMGDDIPDLECMRSVGLPVAPADAAWECIEASRYVSEFAGGKGCVRDIIEQVLRAHGVWAKDSEGVTCSKDVVSA